MTNPKIIYLTTDDNQRVAMHRIGRASQNDKICFLTHGAFSDKRICLGVAKFLAIHDTTCYILEWRNHGDSDNMDRPFSLEEVAIYDIAAALDYLCHKLGHRHIHAITHSGGGICLSMFLSRNPQFTSFIKSMTLVACQAFGAADSYMAYVRLAALKYLTKLIGFVPARLLKLGVVDESYHTMKLWFDWNLSQNFRSNIDGLDYASSFNNIKTPVLAIAANGDKVIAPIHGCLKFYQLFNNPSNQFAEFSLQNSNLENYTHGRIMLSQNASREVWVKIISWISLNEIGQSH